MSNDGLLLDSGELMDHILQALEQKKPLSVISVGATETFVMAQYTLLSEEQFMSHYEAEHANKGETSGFFHRGVSFPNIQTRDDAVAAVREADIVGYNILVDFDGWNTGSMTQKVFAAYDLHPKYVFDSYLRRVVMFSQRKKFEQMLSGRRLLLVGSPAEEARTALNEKYKQRLGLDVVGTVDITHYDQLAEAKKAIDNFDFDLCLLAAGTNAMMLACYISNVHGKVAFDIGSGMSSLITDQVYTDYWLENLIGIDRLMEM